MTHRTLAVVAMALLTLAPGACRNPQVVKTAPRVVNATVKAGRELVEGGSHDRKDREELEHLIGHGAVRAGETAIRRLDAESIANLVLPGQSE